MTTRELYERDYGVRTDMIENPLTDTVGTEPTQLLSPDPGRLNYTLSNLGNTPVYFAFSPDPSADKGHYVAVNGGYVSLDWKEDGILVTLPVWAISASPVKVYLTGIKIIGVKE